MITCSSLSQQFIRIAGHKECGCIFNVLCFDKFEFLCLTILLSNTNSYLCGTQSNSGLSSQPEKKTSFLIFFKKKKNYILTGWGREHEMCAVHLFTHT